MSNLLSRYAEAIYWMARYVERAENLARILDVNESFSRNNQGSQNWASILQLYADEEDFDDRYDTADARNVIYYYVLDEKNPGSILSCVRAARENARTLRPLISTEMWTNLNIFYNRVCGFHVEDVAEERLARLCALVKESCQTHTGITEGTFYRDEGWYFYEIGRSLERADQTTRMLDVKYLTLLPSVHAVGSPLDVSQWNALLRSAAGYHAFRRIHPSGMQHDKVAEFMLFNPSFPRSVSACIDLADRRLTLLRSRYRLRGGAEALEKLDELRTVLNEIGIDQVIRSGLHEFIDGIQLALLEIAALIGRDFFGYDDGLRSEAEPSAAEA
ncbi:MAG: alpha-E domain-containing protein [Rhodovibrionaceae bacterium]